VVSTQWAELLGPEHWLLGTAFP